MRHPDELRYTADHEWVLIEGTRARVGVTDFAQDALGDVVYVGLPAVGSDVVGGDAFGEVESTKSVSDLYAPLSGSISRVNEKLNDQPELINADPYGDGWICEIELSDEVDLQVLLDADSYKALVEG
ncbi:MAG TPA: glycine cleavage system protein GcvH [Ilumatobacteraceae bacterium]|nr:glycine cleavage system protein GcvH [Ilumatobacteraceae bacterium]